MKRKIRDIELIYDMDGYRRIISIDNGKFYNIQTGDVKKYIEIYPDGSYEYINKCMSFYMNIYSLGLDQQIKTNILNYLDLNAVNLIYTDGTKELFYLPVEWYYLGDSEDYNCSVNTLLRTSIKQFGDNKSETISIRVERRQ